MIISISKHLYTFIYNEKKGERGEERETFIPRNGISIGANLREAFRSAGLMSRDDSSVLVQIDTPTVQVPEEEFNEADAPTLFYRCFDERKGHEVMHSELSDLRCVLLFEVSKDMLQVLGERFRQVTVEPFMLHVWQNQYRQSEQGLWKKLYVFFHDQNMELFAFDPGRFRFCNQFDAKYATDCTYFILNAWQQMGFNPERDELHLLGSHKQLAEIEAALAKYIRKIKTQS